MSTGNDDNWTQGSATRRTNLACLNCRRKKQRCSGKRPVCHNCQRLSLDCQYPAIMKYVSTDGHDAKGREENLTWILHVSTAERLSQIEHRLSDMAAKIDCLLDLQNQQRRQAMTQPSVASAPSFQDRVSPSMRPDLGDELRIAEDASFDGLVPQPVIWALIDDFFRRSHNQPYSFFHEQNFRQRVSEGRIPNHLLFAVLASAVRFSSHPFFAGRTHEIAVTFATKSWKAIISSCFARDEKATIMTVQTITLLAIFDFTAGHTRHGSAWIKIGLSVRIAQDLRLMMDPAEKINPFDQEERRRVFWSLYLLDRIVSCGRARPPAILEASCQLQLPGTEQDWKQGRIKETDTLDRLSSKSINHKDTNGPFALVVIMAYILSRAAQYMLQEYNARSRDPPWDSNSDFASICSDLLYIESSFELSKPIENLIDGELCKNAQEDFGSINPLVFSRALFHLCHCLLNHPFLLRHRLNTLEARSPSSFLVRSFDFGRSCARKLTQLLSGAAASGPFVYAPFYGYCAVVAGSIQALHLDSADHGVRLEAMDCVQQNLATLNIIGNFWVNVSGMYDALSSFSCNTARFSILTSSDPQITSLTEEEQSIMWSLVDYNSMSSASQTSRNKQHEAPYPKDTGLQQWFGVFNTIGITSSSTGNTYVGDPSLDGPMDMLGVYLNESDTFEGSNQ